MKTRIALIVLLVGLMPTIAHADVKPNALCSEGMVLQQKTKAKVWGSADQGEKVTVSFRDQKASANADGLGRWVVEVATGAAGGPFEMTIAGNNKISYKNVLVGEVWVCSGQSNMEWSVHACSNTDREFATAAPHNPQLRMFTVKKSPQAAPATETAGTWFDAMPQSVDYFSAAGYFFGRSLQENLKVPVGLIHASCGGTRIETWMSRSGLDAVQAKEPVPKDPSDNSPSALYNGMIHPLLNYRIQGAIWYQGESNAGNAYRYRRLLPGMIEQWRADFKNPDMPFYLVQLAPFTAVSKKPAESTWAEVREAQTMTLKLKNTGMAVITDFGSEYEIHPTPKRPVGERLALAARAQTYGEKIVYSGPLYTSAKFDKNQAVLSFDHVGGGLATKELVPMNERKITGGTMLADWRVKAGSTSAPLVGFAVCGKDRVFHNAMADIVGDTVVVSSAQVAEPIAVRYGWADHPFCNLYNREGLPASPFRTDSFPGLTQPKQ